MSRKVLSKRKHHRRRQKAARRELKKTSLKRITGRLLMRYQHKGGITRHTFRHEDE